MAIHAPTPGFKKTLCGRSSGHTTVYQKQVSCRRCLGGLRNRPEASPLRCIKCCGEKTIGDVPCSACEGRGAPTANEVKDWAGAIVPAKPKGEKQKKGASH